MQTRQQNNIFSEPENPDESVDSGAHENEENSSDVEKALDNRKLAFLNYFALRFLSTLQGSKSLQSSLLEA